jgi:RND family efflux transporter MFP subunit
MKFIPKMPKNKKVLILSASVMVIVAIVLFSIFSNKSDGSVPLEQEAQKGIPVSLYSLDIAQDGSVITTGRVESAQEADLSFTSGGNIQTTSVKIGSKVGSGQILATLDAKDEIAAVVQSEAQLKLAKVQLENTKAQQRASVSGTSENLISTNLQAYPTDDSLDKVRDEDLFPVITGNYNSKEEGVYTITLYSSDQDSGLSFRYSGLETGVAAVSTKAPIPLGKRGLYIQWPETVNLNRTVVWEVPIPNYRSDDYISSENQLEQAVITQETSIKTQEAQVQIAEANLAAARARLEAKRLRAPFSGTVTEVTKGIGDFVSGGESIVSLVSNGQKLIEVNLSSRASQLVMIGDQAVIDNSFSGKVAAIAPAISGNTGVRATIEITDAKADQILVGSVVSVKIQTKTKVSTVGASTSSQDLVPLSSVVSRNGNYVVYVVEGGIAKEIVVEVGKISGDLIEVRGLSNQPSIIKDAFSVREGDSVVVTEQ